MLPQRLTKTALDDAVSYWWLVTRKEARASVRGFVRRERAEATALAIDRALEAVRAIGGPGSICECGLAESYHGPNPPDLAHHRYEPRYDAATHEAMRAAVIEKLESLR